MKILLLQGPMGPFFKHLAHTLTLLDHELWKVNFNGGDQIFSSGMSTINYTGGTEFWAYFLRKTLVTKDIQVIIGYGDCRIYHRIAKKVAKRLQIPIYFFEEGYFRPNFITFEKNGVNNNSTLPRTSDFYKFLEPTANRKEISIGYDFHWRIIFSIIYYLSTKLLSYKYDKYHHHRSISVLYEGLCWLKSGLLKYPYRIISKIKYKKTINKYKNYYLFPLQIKDDAQIKWHYPRGTIKGTLNSVIHSFAQHAPPTTALIIKHHPMDRGHTNYKKYIETLCKKHNVNHRVIYIHDVPNPKIIRNALGMVTINSTMGLSGVLHHRKVLALGKCLYNIDGITYQGSLDSFWTTDFKPNLKLFHSFRNYIIAKSQLNQNFYKPLPFDQIDWNELLRIKHTSKPRLHQNRLIPANTIKRT